MGSILAREKHCGSEEAAGRQVELNMDQQCTHAVGKAGPLLRCVSKDTASESEEVMLWT